jgi:tetratricopeptide (TPR) repeat protein
VIFNSPGNFTGRFFDLLALFGILLLCWPTPVVGQQNNEQFAIEIQSAREALAHNDTAAAIAAYRKAANLRPGTPEIYANLGVLEEESGAYSEAAKDLKQAVGSNPSLFSAVRLNASDIHARFALGRAYMMLKQWPKATTVYRTAVATAPKESSAWFALGISLLQQVEDDSWALSGIQFPGTYRKVLFAEALTEQRRYVEAADLYRETEQETSAPPCVRAARGLVLLRQDHKSEGREELEHSQTNEPSCNLALIGLAAISIQESKVDDGIEMLEESWERDEGFTRSSLPLLISLLSPEQRNTTRSALGRRKTDNNPLLEGHGLASAFVEVDGSQTEASVEGAVDNQSQRPSRFEPTDVRKAEREYAEGHYAACVSQLEGKPVTVAPAFLRLKTICAFLTGNYTVASESASLLRDSLPHDPGGLYWSIRSNENLAIAALNQFAMLAPDSVKTHLLLGDIDRQRRRYVAAVDEYEQCLSMEPTSYAALQGLASSYLLDGKFTDASRVAEKALLQRPNDPQINILMGEALVGERSFETAEPYLKKALAGEPQFVIQAHALLGRVYMQTGRDDEAFTELKLGLSSDDNGSLHYLLGRLYKSRGDKVNADLAFQQAEEFSLDRARRATVALQDSVGIQDSLPQ